MLVYIGGVLIHIWGSEHVTLSLTRIVAEVRGGCMVSVLCRSLRMRRVSPAWGVASLQLLARKDSVLNSSRALCSDLRLQSWGWRNFSFLLEAIFGISCVHSEEGVKFTFSSNWWGGGRWVPWASEAPRSSDLGRPGSRLWGQELHQQPCVILSRHGRRHVRFAAAAHTKRSANLSTTSVTLVFVWLWDSDLSGSASWTCTPSHRLPRSASSAPPAPEYGATELLPLPLSLCFPAGRTRACLQGTIHCNNYYTLSNWHFFQKQGPTGVYLHSCSESAAEGVEDAEAIIQPKCLVVFTEEVNQCVAGLPQLLPPVVQRAQTKVGSLRKQNWSHVHTLGDC